MWAQVPLRLSLQPLLLESLWRRWASSKMILSKKLSTVTSTSTSTSQRVSIKSLSAKQEKKRNWKDNVETPSEGQYSDGRSASSWYCKPPNSKERIARMTKANAPTQLCTWRALELNCGAWLHLRPHQHDCLWLVARTSPALLCTQFQATKATALCLFVVKLRLGASPLVTKSSYARYIVVAAGFKPRAKSPVHMSQISARGNYQISSSSLFTSSLTQAWWTFTQAWWTQSLFAIRFSFEDMGL